MQSPPCLCILGFHCILWQLVLNIIRHISVPRKIIIGFGLFSLDSFTSENLQISVYTVGKSFGIVDIFDRIYFIWPKLMIYANFWNGDGLLFILTIYCFSLGIRRFLSYFLINGYEPIVFCWSSNVFRHHIWLEFVLSKWIWNVHSCCFPVRLIGIPNFRSDFRNCTNLSFR